MQTDPIGITRMMEAYDGKVWNILGQTYTLKSVTESSMVWYAEIPAGAFVPPHIHPTQDELLVCLEGKLDVLLDGQWETAGYGDTIRLPKGIAHGIYNKSDAKAEGLFMVSPTRKIEDLFDEIDNVSDPEEVVRLAAQREVEFLPPEQ